MNVKTTVPLAIAIVLGLVAAIVASQIVKQQPIAIGADGQAPVLNLAEVVVAARDIAPGAELTAEDLKVTRIESATAPQNTQSNPATLFKRVAKVQIPMGQMVHEAMLAEKGVTGGLPGVIEPGMRAMTIEINEFTGVAGLLEPGNRVDILARVAVPESEGGGQMSRTIVQNVPIIAVGSSLTNKVATTESPTAPVVPDAPAATKAMARSITVLVTPEDAEKIDLAASTNQARLALRASTDNETARVNGATLATLRGNGSTARRRELPTQTAAAEKNPADDVFGTTATPAFKPKTTGSRSITVIRAGVPTSIEVEESAQPAPATAVPATADTQSASAD